MSELTIGIRQIGQAHPPLVIAEMSGNHNQSLEKALAIVQAAAEAGAHALKLQTYTADTLTLDCDKGDFLISDAGSPWRGRTLYDLYQEAHTPWQWHKPIFELGRRLGLVVFSTPFDHTAVDFLEELNVPCYKIASFEIVDLPLISKVASTGKPMLMSTGMATVAEIDEAVRTAREAGCRDIVLLKCTSTYPASPENSNVRTIPHLRDLFDCEVGLSDHTLGIGAALGAVALGATVIEKHFTLDRAEGGVDAAFSLEPDEMKLLVRETETAWKALGQVDYGATEKEKVSQQFRRSLYVVKDINAGDVLTRENVRVIRPGLGLPPKFFNMILGRRIVKSVKKGTALTWELVR